MSHKEVTNSTFAAWGIQRHLRNRLHLFHHGPLCCWEHSGFAEFPLGAADMVGAGANEIGGGAGGVGDGVGVTGNGAGVGEGANGVN